MRSFVVALDVGGDLLSRLLQGLELGAPHEPLLELAEPALDEGLRLRVAVAATAVGNAMRGQALAEAPAGEAEPLSVPSVRQPGLIPRAATAPSTSTIASSLRQRSSSDQPTISRVQQSMAAFRYVHPCSATQIEVMSRCQSWSGHSTRK